MKGKKGIEKKGKVEKVKRNAKKIFQLLILPLKISTAYSLIQLKHQHKSSPHA